MEYFFEPFYRAHIDVAECTPRHRRIAEIGVAEIRAGKIGVRDTGFHQLRVAQVCVFQIGITDLRAGQVSAPQIGLATQCAAIQWVLLVPGGSTGTDVGRAGQHVLV